MPVKGASQRLCHKPAQSDEQFSRIHIAAGLQEKTRSSIAPHIKVQAHKLFSLDWKRFLFIRLQGWACVAKHISYGGCMVGQLRAAAQAKKSQIVQSFPQILQGGTSTLSKFCLPQHFWLQRNLTHIQRSRKIARAEQFVQHGAHHSDRRLDVCRPAHICSRSFQKRTAAQQNLNCIALSLKTHARHLQHARDLDTLPYLF
jgi:hypothetical protein